MNGEQCGVLAKPSPVQQKLAAWLRQSGTQLFSLFWSVLQTVPLGQPNPAGSTLELAPGSSFVNGDTLSVIDQRGVRYTYGRQRPAVQPREKGGETYRIAAVGATSPNYDVKILSGTLTVVGSR